jgi:hypothetical protein
MRILKLIEKVKALLEKHPWYANQWQAKLQELAGAERDIVLFMQAARWAESFHNDSLPYSVLHFSDCPKRDSIQSDRV